MHLAAVDPTCADKPVRAFGTFTQDLRDLADWFKACGVTSVAMEFMNVQVTGGLCHRHPALPDQLDRLNLEFPTEPSSPHDPPPAL